MALYTIGKEELKKTCAEIIDFAYDHKPRKIEMNVNAAIDEVATFNLKLEGLIIAPPKNQIKITEEPEKDVEEMLKEMEDA